VCVCVCAQSDHGGNPERLPEMTGQLTLLQSLRNMLRLAHVTKTKSIGKGRKHPALSSDLPCSGMPEYCWLYLLPLSLASFTPVATTARYALIRLPLWMSALPCCPTRPWDTYADTDGINLCWMLVVLGEIRGEHVLCWLGSGRCMIRFADSFGLHVNTGQYSDLD
jgi:hypothetical protein